VFYVYKFCVEKVLIVRKQVFVMTWKKMSQEKVGYPAHEIEGWSNGKDEILLLNKKISFSHDWEIMYNGEWIRRAGSKKDAMKQIKELKED
jgi:hypothetical protein